VKAHSCSITLSSSHSTVPNGSQLTITATLNATENIDTLQAHITYDPSKVTYVSESYAGSDWQDTPDKSSGSGFYRASRFKLPPHTTGAIKIVSLTFRPNVASGRAAFGVTTCCSYAVAAGVNNLSSVQGLRVNFTTP